MVSSSAGSSGVFSNYGVCVVCVSVKSGYRYCYPQFDCMTDVPSNGHTTLQSCLFFFWNSSATTFCEGFS